MVQQVEAKAARVLWLEDDEEDFKGAKAKLEQEGFSVDLVPDVVDFKRKLSSEVYDLIIVDMRGDNFNGVELIKSAELIENPSKLCVLSGYLDEEDIQTVLEGVERDIFILDKDYPFADDVIEVGLESQLKKILNGDAVHTNKTYFSSADGSAFDVSSGKTTYEDYILLNPSEKFFVKNALLDLAEKEIDRLAREGYTSFVICGPNGKVLKRSKTDLGLSSEDLSHYSVAQGFPCFTDARSIRNEEVRVARCGGMYDYYYSVRVSFSGKDDKAYDVHFDSGAEASWFDLKFLKSCNIGRTGDQNKSALLHTTTGVRRVWYFSETRQVAIYDQENEQRFDFTELEIRGLSEWDRVSFSGLASDPDLELCSRCRPKGRCQNRVGLLGSDLIGEPMAVTLLMDGKSKKTKLV